MFYIVTRFRFLAWVAVWLAAASPGWAMAPIVLSEDGSRLVYADTGERFTPWGFNYNRDTGLRLLHEYWIEEWDRVARDLKTMRELGANVVRIHLQTAAFLPAPDTVDAENVAQLQRLVDYAEEIGLYLNLTGLGSYKKHQDPAWYNEIDEAGRWETQARFWRVIARACSGRPSVFCYNLMNEPVIGAGDVWVVDDDLSGLHFVQRIALDLNGRTRAEIARAWVDTMAEAIHNEDDATLITVGVIPWVFHWGGGQPLFYSEEVRGNLDFTSVHFYPRHGEVDNAIEALKAYDVGMPLVIEETAPLRCSMEEFAEFIERSREIADGWLGFFWGGNIETLAEQAQPLREPPYDEWEYEDWTAYYEELDGEIDEDLREAAAAYLMHEWLTYFRDAAPRMTGAAP